VTQQGSLVGHLLDVQRVVGSSPAWLTMELCGKSFHQEGVPLFVSTRALLFNHGFSWRFRIIGKRAILENRHVWLEFIHRPKPFFCYSN